MNFSRTLLPLLIALAAALPASAKPLTIKFATLAPEGSAWMKVMQNFAAEVKEKTAGRVKFRMYPGGVQGDEKDVVRKIRIGQLQAGGFTGVGIGEIAPAARVLDTPFLFKSAAEIDHVYGALDAEFRKMFDVAGYVLLGWAEVGDVLILSNSPVKTPEDLKAVKMWIWEGDPIAEASFAALGVKPIPLSITDVMTSLQTGMIDGLYGSPLAVLALQWHTRMKYALSLPMANASGAVLLSKKAFGSLSKEDQDALLAAGDRHFRELTRISRADNAKSIDLLKKSGISFTSPAGGEAAAEFRKSGNSARAALTGKLYPEKLLERIEKVLADFRSQKKKK
ncbi:MAG: Extracellular solute-binding protein family 7 [Elusimicrobia bacterium]|nr:MAG: Extracellular solute-binding protein family 7 [Elusimicrobiota bacterium]KAF0157303.1 MAG: Extracellular solute-binding protein family 7 [Elusimicrobiota bacterium]